MSTSPDRPKFWLLDGKTPKPTTLSEWIQWFEDDDRHRRVALTRIGEDVVSTVFLGIDHSMGGPVPLLFETMIFVGPNEKWCTRCTTWEQAEDQHAEAVTELKLWHQNAAKTATTKD